MTKRLIFFPSSTQELLLKAALLDGKPAIESWNAWRAAIAIDDIDIGSQRLLPLLYQNIHRLGVSHPDLERYKSVHRYVWVANNLRIRETVEILGVFEAAAIPVLLLKGIALAPLCYGDLGQRPMADLDLLVPGSHAVAAATALNAAGWVSPDTAPLGALSFQRANHAITFIKRGTPTEADLHWHAAHELLGENDDEVFWSRAQNLDIGDISARTLSDTDHLLLICIHGARPNEVAPIRWVADAAMLIRRGKIDWTYLAARTRSGGFSRRLSGVFRYLQTEFDVSIPETFMAELADAPVRNVEIWEEWFARRQRWRSIAVFGQFLSFLARSPYYSSTPRGLFAFMRARWSTNSLAHTVLQIVRRTAKHISGEFRTPP